jgi:hypothetical protein
MSLALAQTKSALAPGLTASFHASGGTEPYVYSVRAGGAGGTINASTGVYTAPATLSSDPEKAFDVVAVTDALSAKTAARIRVANAFGLLCDILANYLDLDASRVVFWDQKIMLPTDSDLFIAVSMMTCKPFGNSIGPGSSGWDESVQSVNMYAACDIDIMSRGPAARDRKEEVLLALNSLYSQAQQESNSFYIGRLPVGSQFICLNNVDGAAIPYRYKITVALQYTVTKTKTAEYFDTFQDVQVNTDP